MKKILAHLVRMVITKKKVSTYLHTSKDVHKNEYLTFLMGT